LCNNDLSGVEELDEGTRQDRWPGYSSGSEAEVPPRTGLPACDPVLPQWVNGQSPSTTDLDKYGMRYERSHGNNNSKEDKDKRYHPAVISPASAGGDQLVDHATSIKTFQASLIGIHAWTPA
jgi:hypothetical protein